MEGSVGEDEENAAVGHRRRWRRLTVTRRPYIGAKYGINQNGDMMATVIRIMDDDTEWDPKEEEEEEDDDDDDDDDEDEDEDEDEDDDDDDVKLLMVIIFCW
ncbi:hypothetical protein L1987_64105 [Smallanthus sonchifolius]|uniref:Uncharacterized protein n=1 Tax=Smallanthus sonchifolius TaxID=185202 RepID=A0ACB9CF12_9ASTR|nr:hypothetical protein L1987_64105 [Smallanthus sonchifolius]